MSESPLQGRRYLEQKPEKRKSSSIMTKSLQVYSQKVHKFQDMMDLERILWTFEQQLNTCLTSYDVSIDDAQTIVLALVATTIQLIGQTDSRRLSPVEIKAMRQIPKKLIKLLQCTGLSENLIDVLGDVDIYKNF